MLATPDIKKKTRKLCQQKEWTEGCSTGRAEAEAGGTQSLSPLQTSVTHDTGTKGDAPCPTSKWGGGWVILLVPWPAAHSRQQLDPGGPRGQWEPSWQEESGRSLSAAAHSPVFPSGATVCSQRLWGAVVPELAVWPVGPPAGWPELSGFLPKRTTQWHSSCDAADITSPRGKGARLAPHTMHETNRRTKVLTTKKLEKILEGNVGEILYFGVKFIQRKHFCVMKGTINWVVQQ